MRTYFCDWTQWQGIILPARQIADEGFGGVWIKSSGSESQGGLFIDPAFVPGAAALLNEPRLVPGVFHYLRPGKPATQAALMVDLAESTGLAEHGCLYKLDVETNGLTPYDVERFVEAFQLLTSQNQSLWIYTNLNNWKKVFPSVGSYNAAIRGCVLEEAHWVPENVRMNPSTPFASQQYKAVNEDWRLVNYGGWTRASMLQFSNHIRVAGRYTMGSAYAGSQKELTDTYMR